MLFVGCRHLFRAAPGANCPLQPDAKLTGSAGVWPPVRRTTASLLELIASSSITQARQPPGSPEALVRRPAAEDQREALHRSGPVPAALLASGCTPAQTEPSRPDRRQRKDASAAALCTRRPPATVVSTFLGLSPQVRNGATVTMASKNHRGRWSGMDAGNDQSDDQVCKPYAATACVSSCLCVLCQRAALPFEAAASGLLPCHLTVHAM